ncbi:MAG TPA: M56 family metallopeptidase [Allosphingosinicella sp.]|nr:M56 family metallopeptidase [Allosphingosinicella sp.]
MDVSFFGEMAWKSALISGAALGLAYVLRSRAAADRALVLRLGVGMLLLLPFIALALPSLQIVAWAAPEPAPIPAFYAAAPELQAALPAGAPLAAPPPTIWDDPTPLVLLLYIGGLLMVGARLAAGLFMLGRWTRSGRMVDCPEWQAAFDRVRWTAPDSEAVRLLVSDTVPSPLSWGWRRPVILIDPDTLAQPEEADAILAHEMAHVARRDWPALMLTRLAATLFWFNPLVWLLEREVVQQAEEAADCAAAERVEPTVYARTLLSWAQVNGRMIPANSIAPSGSALSRRVRAILDRQMRERPAGSPWTAIAAVLCIGIAAPVAAMQLVQAAQAPAAPEPPAAPPTPIAPNAPAAPATPDAPSAPPAPLAPVAPTPDVTPVVQAALAEVLPQIPTIVAEATSAAGAIDPEEIEEAVQEAMREARPHARHMSPAESARMSREIRRAVQHAQVEVRRVNRVEIAAAMREAQVAVRAAQPAIALAMANGATGMESGAVGMESGARRMEEQAARFRDRAQREQIIAREAQRGHHVTHDQLIDAANDMEEGARGMREGAREMREAAQRMRRGDTD